MAKLVSCRYIKGFWRYSTFSKIFVKMANYIQLGVTVLKGICKILLQLTDYRTFGVHYTGQLVVQVLDLLVKIV